MYSNTYIYVFHEWVWKSDIFSVSKNKRHYIEAPFTPLQITFGRYHKWYGLAFRLRYSSQSVVKVIRFAVSLLILLGKGSKVIRATDFLARLLSVCTIIVTFYTDHCHSWLCANQEVIHSSVEGVLKCQFYVVRINFHPFAKRINIETADRIGCTTDCWESCRRKVNPHHLWYGSYFDSYQQWSVAV